MSMRPPTLPPLYPHQADGAAWLCQQTRAALFDDMGLGKTITATEAASRVRATQEWDRKFRTLVVCPTVVVWNWRSEWWRWSWFPHDGVTIVQHLDQEIEFGELTIVTHSMLLDDRVLDQLHAAEFDLVILDESHLFRSRKARRTIAFYGERRGRNHHAEGLIDSAHRTWVLTGTPMPNDVRDLYPMFGLLWADYIDDDHGHPYTYASFERTFARLEFTRWGSKVTSVKRPKLLGAHLREHALRRTKGDHLDLPPIRHETVTLRPDDVPLDMIELTHRQIEKLAKQADSAEEVLDALGGVTHLSRWRRQLGELKVQPTVDFLTPELQMPLGENEKPPKMVLFAQHLTVIHELARRLNERGVWSKVITGATSAEERRDIVRRFERDPMLQVVVAQLQAGSVGTTLVAASECVLVEQSWLPADNWQAVDRIHRIGQTKHCRARHISLAGTLDEAVTRVVTRKTAMIREVLDEE